MKGKAEGLRAEKEGLTAEFECWFGGEPKTKRKPAREITGVEVEAEAFIFFPLHRLSHLFQGTPVINSHQDWIFMSLMFDLWLMNAWTIAWESSVVFLS